MTRRAASSPPRGLSFPIVHLDAWIRANRKDLVPPVSNRQLFTGSKDLILFVSGGPNTRNDYHVNATEEWFLQLKGDIAVRVRPLDGSPPHDVIVREGEMFLLDRWVPHRPQRPPGTLGLIVEFPRGLDEHGNPHQDALRWYCPQCDDLVHEVKWVLRKIDEDLKVIMNGFWGGPVEQRTCRRCGHVIERAGAVELKGRKVSAVKKAGKTGPAAARRAPAKKKTAKRSAPSKTALARR
jgi:3-hydroxyanthranilate 3,4-dioxygenase